MPDGTPNQLSPNMPWDTCNMCGKEIGENAAKKSTQGFPYCDDCRNGGWRDKLSKK